MVGASPETLGHFCQTTRRHISKDTSDSGGSPETLGHFCRTTRRHTSKDTSDSKAEMAIDTEQGELKSMFLPSGDEYPKTNTLDIHADVKVN
jgi:hypothetical protein